jgi:hypothetical protein
MRPRGIKEAKHIRMTNTNLHLQFCVLIHDILRKQDLQRSSEYIDSQEVGQIVHSLPGIQTFNISN